MPHRLLSITTSSGELVPAWYSDRDRPWLRDLLADVEACAGRPLTELTRRWRGRAADPRAFRRLAPARHLVLRALRRGPRRADLGVVRRELFAAAARGTARDDAIAAIALRHGLTVEALDAGLFSDLACARPVHWPSALLDPTRLILALNLAIAQGMLRRAERADLTLHGASRSVLRTAWLQGAWFTVVRADRHGTLLRWWPAHGAAVRGLAAVAPVLPWAKRFELRARCRVHGEVGTFVLTTHDAILPGPEPRAFDSALERRFARDLLSAAPDWELSREPAPVVAGGGMAFPDFELRHRATGSAWLLEIAGLRDRAALPSKLAMLCTVSRLLLCLPRAVVPADFADHPRVIPFAGRVDAGAVIQRLAELDSVNGGRV